MVSPFRRFETPARPTTEDELAALFEEAQRRGVNIGAALALAATPQEAVANIKRRLATTTPQAQAPQKAGPNSLQRFLAAAGEQYQRINQASQSFLPSNQEIVGELKKIGAGLLESPIPEAFVTRAPTPLQPAARVIRESASPLAAATLPIGGSARVVVGGLLGAAGGATAGQAVGGDVGELVGAVGGGVAGGIPAVQRLAGRGATATLRGGQRLAEEAGRTNVGNVLLPRAPAGVAKPLIYENLHPIERQLYGIESKGRLTLDEVEGARDYLYGPVDSSTGRRSGGLVSPDDTARIQNFEERYRGTHQLADRRREVARVLAKYVEIEKPKTAGPIAQAGFGGEMGPGQVARGAAEQSRMTQAPLSEIAASEADRIAKARAPVPVPRAPEARAFARAEDIGGAAKPDIPPNMPESSVQARKRPDGKWQLFFIGTRNEVFPNELFASVSEAKMAFKVARAKAGQAVVQSPVAPSLPSTTDIPPAAPLQGRQVAHAATGDVDSVRRQIESLRITEDRVVRAIAKVRAASLPSVPDGYMRLYRGESTGSVRPVVPPPSAPVSATMVPGRWFTPDVSYAAFYGPELAYVDVPIDVAKEAGAIRQATGGNLSIEWAAKAKPIAAAPPPSVAAGTARGSLPPQPPTGGVPPSTKPPVPPAGTPPSQPPLMPTRPSGIEETLKQAKAIVERDRPGITSRLMDYVPGLKQIRHGVQPALDMPETMTAGWVGQGLAEGKVETSLQQARIAQLARLDKVFGKNATATRDFKPTGVAFNGTAEQAKYPYVGTLADIMERPALYGMSAEQRAAITATHNERSLAFGGTKADYALDIGEHPVQPGGVHMPSVGVGEDDIEIAGSLENALRRGRAKTRIYPTLADRWAHDNKFRPETSVAKLFAADDGTLATLAGRKVLSEGLGGKTRLQVMQETHPQLAAKMDILQKKLGSLRATAARIGGQQAEAIDNFMQSPLDPADLATLQADLNPRVGANAVGRQGPNFGKDFKALKAEVAAAKAQIADLRPMWEDANLKPYVFVQDRVYKYFPVKEAKQVEELLKTSDSKMLRIIDNLRATAFGGDLSPVSIQGVTAWFSDPIGVSRFFAQGKGGLSQASVLADMKANPASWQRFTAATGINPLGGVEKEFSTGYLSHPKLGKLGKGWKEWNEALYRPITKLQKDIFDNSYDAAVKHGLGPEQAAAVAADDATKIIPRSNFRRLGQSTRDAARYRAALTSVSFLTQPVALMNDATKGLVKIGTKQTLTRSEVFAVKRVLTLVAATEAIAITSNVYHAQTHNLDLDQAAKDSLNPNSGKFMSLVFPNGGRIGLGGPFRSIIRMVAPREIEGSPVPVPFGGLEQFAKGKMGPVARIGYDEIRNRDYYGKAIRTENFPVNILQGIEYALEGSAPLTVGSAAQQLRKGESIGTVAEEAASQFAGTNLQPDDPAYAASLLWKKDVKPYFEIPADAKEARDKGKPTRTAYRRNYPQVEAKLFIAGDVTSLSTDAAKREVVRLMKEHNITVADIDHLAPKNYESDAHAALRRYFESETRLPKANGKGAGKPDNPWASPDWR